MIFARPFHLLVKYTEGLHGPEVIDSISDNEMESVAQYLGMTLDEPDRRKAYDAIQRELAEQNRFLTVSLKDKKISASELYFKSQFIRDIVENTRKNSGR